MLQASQLVDAALCTSIKRFAMDEDVKGSGTVGMLRGSSTLRGWAPTREYKRIALLAARSWHAPISNAQFHDVLLVYFTTMYLVDSGHPYRRLLEVAGLGSSEGAELGLRCEKFLQDVKDMAGHEETWAYCTRALVDANLFLDAEWVADAVPHDVTTVQYASYQGMVDRETSCTLAQTLWGTGPPPAMLAGNADVHAQPLPLGDQSLTDHGMQHNPTPPMDVGDMEDMCVLWHSDTMHS